MEIRVLGCSGGVGPGLRTTSLLIDNSVLIDAGTGVGDLSLSQMTDLHHLLLTHSHLDHVCGLAFIVDNLFGVVEHTLRVHAIPETLRVLREHLFNDQLWPDFTRLLWKDAPVVNLEPLAPGLPLLLDGVRCTPFRVDHSVPAVGYAVEDGGAVFAFSGDTGGGPLLWDALNALPRLDHLMIEVAFPDEDAELGRIAKHFTPAVLGAQLAGLRHRPMLHLSHQKPGVEQMIEAECATALAGWNYRHLKRGDTILC
jgi:ribonuclease BN (tRNA processing enzyme)